MVVMNFNGVIFLAIILLKELMAEDIYVRGYDCTAALNPSDCTDAPPVMYSVNKWTFCHAKYQRQWQRSQRNIPFDDYMNKTIHSDRSDQGTQDLSKMRTYSADSISKLMKLEAVTEKYKTFVCSIHLMNKEGVFNLEDRYFAAVRQDSIETFECAEVRGRVAELDYCIDELPVMVDGRLRFMTAVERMLVDDVTMLAVCSRFPPMFPDENGVWFSLSPKIKREPTPKSLSEFFAEHPEFLSNQNLY